MICPECGKEDGNDPIWVHRPRMDPPDCYCERKEGEKPYCKSFYLCHADFTQYPCKNCMERA